MLLSVAIQLIIQIYS